MTTERLVVVRGGGDIATGVIWRLVHAGLRVVVTELAVPLTVRRAVAVSSAVLDARIDIEGMVAQLVVDGRAALKCTDDGRPAVMVSAGLPGPSDLAGMKLSAVVDARLAKVNLDTTIDDAPTVVGLGPGFTAGVDCHAVVETNRGRHLGRTIWDGSAEPDTGTPGMVDGRGAERVLRSPAVGHAEWLVEIGDPVAEGSVIGSVATQPVVAPFDGVARGLISPRAAVAVGTKIGDIDPRCNRQTCFEISDKALAVGGGVVEAVLGRIDGPVSP